MLSAWLNHCNRYSSKSYLLTLSFHFYLYPFFCPLFSIDGNQHRLWYISFLRSSTSCSLRQNHFCCLFFMPVLNMLAAMLHSILMYHETHWEHTLETSSYEQIMHKTVTYGQWAVPWNKFSHICQCFNLVCLLCRIVLSVRLSC